MKALFIHHSTGGLLLRFGKLREILRNKVPNIELWDHGYNLYPSRLLSKLFGPLMFRTGLSDEKGKMTGTDFNIIVSNNSPKEYAEIFGRDPKDSTLKNILSFDVVVFKNCFPTSKIESKEQLEKDKNYYASILRSVHKYPNRFIIFTPPPLRSEVTKPEWAGNARELASWLVKQSKGNVSVFNFFDSLSDSVGNNANMLKREYCNPIPIDSHPNIRANREVGEIFVEFLLKKNSGN